MLATLNHPHTGAISGLEESDGVTALVLEPVEGETLAARLMRGPVSVPQALGIARQITLPVLLLSGLRRSAPEAPARISTRPLSTWLVAPTDVRRV
jgi:hypothetical protein